MWYFRTRANTSQNDILSAQSDRHDLPSLLRPAFRSVWMLNQVPARQTCHSVCFLHAVYPNATQNRIVRLGHKSVQVTEISVLAPTFTVIIGSDTSSKTQTRPNTTQCKLQHDPRVPKVPYDHTAQPRTCKFGTQSDVFDSFELTLAESTATPARSRPASASTAHAAPLKLLS